MKKAGGAPHSEEEEDEDDDLSRHLRIVFPEMRFEDLFTPEDEHLLKPIIMTMYALSLNADKTFSLAGFQPIEFDAARREYALTATIGQEARIAFDDWDALLTVTPMRINSVTQEPFYNEENGLCLTRVRVVVGSILSPLRKNCLMYCKRRRSILFALKERSTRDVSSVLAIQDTPQRTASEDLGTAQSQLFQEARRRFNEWVEELCAACRNLSRKMEIQENDSTTVYRQAQNVLEWMLPANVVMDVRILSKLLTDFDYLVLECTTVLRVVRGGGSQNRPHSLNHVVEFRLIPSDTDNVVVTDSQTTLYMAKRSTRTSAHTPDTAWNFVIDTAHAKPSHTIHERDGGEIEPSEIAARTRSARRNRETTLVPTLYVDSSMPRPRRMKRHRYEEETQDTKEIENDRAVHQPEGTEMKEPQEAKRQRISDDPVHEVAQLEDPMIVTNTDDDQDVDDEQEPIDNDVNGLMDTSIEAGPGFFKRLFFNAVWPF